MEILVKITSYKKTYIENVTTFQKKHFKDITTNEANKWLKSDTFQSWTRPIKCRSNDLDKF